MKLTPAKTVEAFLQVRLLDDLQSLRNCAQSVERRARDCDEAARLAIEEGDLEGFNNLGALQATGVELDRLCGVVGARYRDLKFATQVVEAEESHLRAFASHKLTIQGLILRALRLAAADDSRPGFPVDGLSTELTEALRVLESLS